MTGPYPGNDGPWRQELITVAALSDWKWPHFTPEEMACRGTGEMLIVPAFMDRLQRLRAVFGRPMVVTSGYRTPAYNARVSRTGRSGPHTTGRAVDVAVAGEEAFHLIQIALAHGFNGIGVGLSGHPRHRPFVHLDDLRMPDFPRPRFWNY